MCAKCTISLYFCTWPISSDFESSFHWGDGNLISVTTDFSLRAQPNSRGLRHWVWVSVCVLGGSTWLSTSLFPLLVSTGMRWTPIHLVLMICPCRIRGKKRCRDVSYTCPGSAFSSDSWLCHFWDPLWGTVIILLSCDRLALERNCKAVKGSICLVTPSLPRRQSVWTTELWSAILEGQREKANVQFKLSANVSEYDPTTLLASCTNPLVKRLFFFAHANNFQFSQSTIFSCTSLATLCVCIPFLLVNSWFNSMYSRGSFYFLLQWHLSCYMSLHVCLVAGTVGNEAC